MAFLTSPGRVAVWPRLRSGYAATSSIAMMSFHSLLVRLALNENDTNRDNLEDIYEQEKEAELKLARQGKAKWNEVLASNSESDIKADRGELNKDPIFKKTQDKIENRRRKGWYADTAQ
ncbi:hypothetical protein V1517DRAFT_334775 [Lipomyces orientalis]|uniref:Uncharacterized protein n=1 Tax=Lipomyces orientalis TaxID=1233043 RepID=A0ACC3TC66_9ASCO